MFETVRSIISEKLDIPEEKIQPDSTFADLKLDSLDMVEVVCELEERLDLRFAKDMQPKTMAELVAQVEALQAV